MAAPTISPAVGIVQSKVFFLDSQLTTTDLTAVVKFNAPQKIKVLACSVVSRAKGGTHAATVFDFKQGSSVISSIDVAAVAAGTRADGTIVAAQAVVAKGVEISVDFTETGGTTPTLDDVSLQIDYIAVP